jgi:hypothetical protein
MNVIILKKGDNYRGYHGIIRSYIPSKYEVQIDVGNMQRKLLINKAWVKKYSDDVVKVIKGDYKNAKGKIVNRYEAEIIVNVTAIGKDHKYKKKDVFYTDFLLTNDSYVQVNEILIVDSIMKINGYEMRKDHKIVKMEVDTTLIKKVMPAFELYVTQENIQVPFILKSYVSSSNYKNEDDPEEENRLEELVYQEEQQEQDQESEQESEQEQDQKSEQEQNQESEREQEDDMKVSFADIERSAYESKKLTKDQEEYQMYIRQLGSYLDIVDKYDIFQKAESIMKNIVEPGYIINATQQGESKEIAMETYNELKSMNLKFIIACLVFYDLNRSRSIAYDTFFGNIPKTYFNKNEDMDKIVRNIFLTNDVPRIVNLTDEEMNILGKYVEENNKEELIKYSLRRCDKNLRMILNIGVFDIGNIQLQSVKKMDMEVDKKVSLSSKELSKDQQIKNRMRELKGMIERGLDKDGKYDREMFDLEAIEYLNKDEKELVKKILEFEETLKRLGDPKGKLRRKINMITKAIFVNRYKNQIMNEISKLKVEDTDKRDSLEFAYKNFERADVVLSSMGKDDIIDKKRSVVLSKIYNKFIKQYNDYLVKKWGEQEEDLLTSKMSKMEI